jgi:hypothetical protein
MGLMSASRLVRVIGSVAGALCLAACGNVASASSTTSPSSVPADATVNESFSSTLAVGGSLFYSFSMAQYGNVAITLTGVTGSDVPDSLTLNVGIGRPAGTACTASTTVIATPGDAPQVTGSYGPGIFCVFISDSGLLTAPVKVDAEVAHS